MILIDYVIASSKINLAGKGIFSRCDIPRGRVVSAPDKIERLYSIDEINNMPRESAEYAGSVRWFEDRYSAVGEWSDECYYNHSFDPNCVWHLGFVFASRDISDGTELTIDYRFLLEEGEKSMFRDSETGQYFAGLSFKDSVRLSAEKIVEIFK